jgi:anti-sigma regulatory factor (Ser/Thr protein kinase)
MPGRRTGQAYRVEPFTIEAAVDGGPGAARRARDIVRGELAGRVPGGRLGDVALLVTELVANGVKHGGAIGGERRLHLRFHGRSSALRVEVEDPGGSGTVAPRPPDTARGGGLGLHIVDRVATRWGVDGGRGTSVWFELDCR